MSALSDALAAFAEIDAFHIDNLTVETCVDGAKKLVELDDIIDAGRDSAMDWIAKALPWLKQEIKYMHDVESVGGIIDNKKLATLTALIAQAEVTEKEGNK